MWSRTTCPKEWWSSLVGIKIFLYSTSQQPISCTSKLDFACIISHHCMHRTRPKNVTCVVLAGFQGGKGLAATAGLWSIKSTCKSRKPERVESDNEGHYVTRDYHEYLAWLHRSTRIIVHPPVSSIPIDEPREWRRGPVWCDHKDKCAAAESATWELHGKCLNSTMPSRCLTWKVRRNDDYACTVGNSASSPFQWGWSLPWTCSRVKNSYLEEFSKVIPLCLCIWTIPRTICKHLSFDMNTVAEGVDILSTDGLQVELHVSQRCTSASSCIPRTTNPYKAKGSYWQSGELLCKM
jgi:hypothetical protein